MNHDQMIEAKIKELFRTRPWGGILSIDEAIAHAIEYRQGLSAEDRAVYDKQILMGRHHSKVVETVEIISGRETPKTNPPVERKEPAILKAS